MRGVLLDKRGHVEGQGRGLVHSFVNPGEDQERILHGAPAHVAESLKRSRELAGPGEPRGSLQTWEETLYATTADGPALGAASTEGLIVPLFTLPANFLYPGRLLKWTFMGRQSTAITTPGTLTYRLAYSATGLGAVAVASSGAFAPDVTAVGTNLTVMGEWWCMCRSQGTAGTVMGWGRFSWSDWDDVSVATYLANKAMELAPVSAPATAAVDTTVARALMPTLQSSVTTSSFTCHAAFLEALT